MVSSAFRKERVPRSVECGPSDGKQIHARVGKEPVISVEDHRFYSHPGVDLLAIGRAAFNDLRTLSFAEGGSTITQQLAKNEYFTQEKTLTRKIAEVFMALKIERELDKDTILSLYVNSINFGSGYETVAAASWAILERNPVR